MCGVADGIRLHNQIALWRRKEAELSRKVSNTGTDCVADDFNCDAHRLRTVSVNVVDGASCSPSAETLRVLRARSISESMAALTAHDTSTVESTVDFGLMSSPVTPEEIPSIDNVKNIVSAETGVSKEELGSIFVDEKLKNGVCIKVLLTEQYLKRLAQNIPGETSRKYSKDHHQLNEVY